MYYFAYGSNLSICRLLQRVDSAYLIATGKLRQHQLIFHKIGRDGSAKCDAFYTGQTDDVIYGAIYKINPDQKVNLDNAEGLGIGYEIKYATIVSDDGQYFHAFTYYATRIAKDIQPFHWYKEHVLAGAREHVFPKPYIEKIAAIEALEDTDIKRTEQELSIYSPEPNSIS